MLKAALARLVDGRSLSEAEAADAMRAIVDGSAPAPQVGAYLVALRMKGETVPEILGSARVVREMTTRVPAPEGVVIDTCGTGGDGSSSFNISTAAALVAASGGLFVAKHGNRSVSSRCGSADLLEACGLPLDLLPEETARVLAETRLGFLFAPALNGAMGAVAPIRRAIGLRTVFNLLGPLANPAGATRQVLGVYQERWVEPIAEVLSGLGSERALVVHGMDGLDEISVSGPTRAALLENGRVRALTLEPRMFDVPIHPRGSLAGGDPEENREGLMRVLRGAPGALRDAVIANSAAALWIGGAAGSPAEGADLARQLLDSGAALATLERLVQTSLQARAGRAPS